MPEICAAAVLHDDTAYLTASIAAVRSAVPVLAFVSHLPWHGEPGDWERAAEIASDAGAQVVLGDWADETEHRRAALAHAREKGFTHALIPDGDEIIEPKLLATLLQIAQNELAERVFVHMDTFWKSDRYVIRPREAITPAILLDLRVVKHEHIREFTGGRPLLLSPEHGVIRHMSYAGSNERIFRKITTWTHRDEVVPGWYENVWLGWDENKLMRNLHPTHPGAYGFAERVFTAEDAEGAEEGKGSREDAKARSAEVGRGFRDRIDRITRRDCDHGAGLCRSGQRARRAVCSGLEVPVMTARGSVSRKAGEGRLRPPRAAPSTPDALRPTPVRNNENRMLNELRPSGANHTMTYHENGLRWSSQRGGSTQIVSYIWLEQDVLNTYLQTGLQVRYDVVDGEILAERRGAERYLYVPDPLGTVHHLLNPSQTKVATYTFSPYGETVALTGLELPAQFVGNLGYMTLTTNRVYVRARWYRPDLGRWMTEDPLWPRSTSAGYAYSHGSPARFVDPRGLVACEQPDCCKDIVAPWGNTDHCLSGLWADCPTAPQLARRCAPMFSRDDCAELRAVIATTVKACDTMCAGGAYGGDDQWGAGTLCCTQVDGKTTKWCSSKCCDTDPWYTHWQFGKLTKTEACAFMCLLEHELEHKKQCDGTKPFDECGAYARSVDCLAGIYKARCVDARHEKPLQGVEKCLGHLGK